MKKSTINAETAEAAEKTKEFSASACSAVHFLGQISEKSGRVVGRCARVLGGEFRLASAQFLDHPGRTRSMIAVWL